MDRQKTELEQTFNDFTLTQSSFYSVWQGYYSHTYLSQYKEYLWQALRECCFFQSIVCLKTPSYPITITNNYHSCGSPP